MKKPVNYVDNKRLYEDMKEFHRLNTIAKHNGDIRPDIPRYVGKSLILIAENLANTPSFSGYTFKEEMIGDGIINCIKYAVENFDPETGDNPFAYFTTIIKFAFIRRIEAEKKQLYIKYKNYNRMNMEDTMDGVETESTELYESIQEFIKTYENKLAVSKREAKIKRDARKQVSTSN